MYVVVSRPSRASCLLDAKLSWTVLSIAGVMMITNPFGPYLYPGSWAADDQLPVDPLNKLLGIGIALASIIVFGLEGDVSTLGDSVLESAG